jgi:hypothetical protein
MTDKEKKKRLERFLATTNAPTSSEALMKISGLPYRQVQTVMRSLEKKKEATRQYDTDENLLWQATEKLGDRLSREESSGNVSYIE